MIDRCNSNMNLNTDFGKCDVDFGTVNAIMFCSEDLIIKTTGNAYNEVQEACKNPLKSERAFFLPDIHVVENQSTDAPTGTLGTMTKVLGSGTLVLSFTYEAKHKLNKVLMSYDRFQGGVYIVTTTGIWGMVSVDGLMPFECKSVSVKPGFFTSGNEIPATKITIDLGKEDEITADMGYRTFKGNMHMIKGVIGVTLKKITVTAGDVNIKVIGSASDVDYSSLPELHDVADWELTDKNGSVAIATVSEVNGIIKLTASLVADMEYKLSLKYLADLNMESDTELTFEL